MDVLIPPGTGGIAVKIHLFEELLREPVCGCVLAEVLISRVRVALAGEVSRGAGFVPKCWGHQAHPCRSWGRDCHKPVCEGCVLWKESRCVHSLFDCFSVFCGHILQFACSECVLCARASM